SAFTLCLSLNKLLHGTSTSNFRSSISSVVARFEFEFIRLHRQIIMYNQTSRNHLLMYDWIFKFGGSVTLSILAIQGVLQLNQSTIFILSIFLFSYILLQSVQLKLIHF